MDPSELDAAAATPLRNVCICEPRHETISQKLPGVLAKPISEILAKDDEFYNGLMGDGDGGGDDAEACQLEQLPLEVAEGQMTMFTVEEEYDIPTEKEVIEKYKKTPVQLRLRPFRAMMGTFSKRTVYPVRRSKPVLKVVAKFGSMRKTHKLPNGTTSFATQHLDARARGDAVAGGASKGRVVDDLDGSDGEIQDEGPVDNPDEDQLGYNDSGGDPGTDTVIASRLPVTAASARAADTNAPEVTGRPPVKLVKNERTAPHPPLPQH